MEAAPLTLLVWDAPNIDMTLGDVTGAKPGAGTRPHFEQVGAWLVRRAAKHGSEVEGAVFVNLWPAQARSMQGFVSMLRSTGFRVFARPKVDGGSDIDADMLELIRLRSSEGRLREVVVASCDGRNVEAELTALAERGIKGTVLGFAESAGWAIRNEHLAFVDLEEVPGCFASPLGRMRLDQLPAEGAWFEPTGSLEGNLVDRSQAVQFERTAVLECSRQPWATATEAVRQLLMFIADNDEARSFASSSGIPLTQLGDVIRRVHADYNPARDGQLQILVGQVLADPFTDDWGLSIEGTGTAAVRIEARPVGANA